MSNIVRDIKNPAYCFFNYIINTKNFDPHNMKIDEKWHKNIFTYYIGYVLIKNLKHVKTYSAYLLYLIFSKVNGYFEEINGKEFLKLVPNNESKEKRNKHRELC